MANLNANFRGKWVNAQPIGLSEADLIAIWNERHPANPIDPRLVSFCWARIFIRTQPCAA